MLGLLQGPTELLPISSSAHTLLIAQLAGWDYEDLDPAVRKSFEVALHAGTAAALLLSSQDDLREIWGDLSPRQAVSLALALGPVALFGYRCERAIEGQLSGPRMVSLGLMAGAIAMTVADLLGGQRRTFQMAGMIDGALLGLAQATALVPGISRSGAALTVARARGFSREDSQRLSWQVGLPVIVGASALKAKRLLESHSESRSHTNLLAGATMALLSSAASLKVFPLLKPRSLVPFGLYRLAIGAAIGRRTTARVRARQ